MKEIVVVGLSGGVDSAVSCLLLKQAGYKVIAVFMQNWDSFLNNESNYNSNNEKCDAQYDYDDAKKVADIIGVHLHKVDFIKEYWDNVFKYFIDEYEKGRTPNPDILCNSYIKFNFFLKYSIENFKCNYIAMGHYANVIHEDKESLLIKAKDENKDQTYFLCNLSQYQLSKALFPIGHLTKDEVRSIAKENNLPVWDKKDSVGICFIGKRNFKEFLSNYIPNSPGNIIDIKTKQKVGEHIGVMYYTIGQNNGLNISGAKSKYFVCDKNINEKELMVVSEEYKNEYLLSQECLVENFNWITIPKQNNDLQVRFRHRQELIKCRIEILENDEIMIYYSDKALAVALGQYAVIYDKNICCGGGIVKKLIK